MTYKKIYPPGYGEYDPRKYAFEKVIEVFKDYSDAFYRKAIKKYTKCLNTNSHSKSRWVYDVKNESFVTLECVDCEKANLKEAEEKSREAHYGCHCSPCGHQVSNRH